ncbi:unnamed protein product [Vitrella brassicaformis CCMP3155]|uniref:Uncharacterized protein n=1 Tax=Vitrella brassicaformis (strain CCMP3155) TaxID=1169540 RepID=A0A0G4G6W4_VITBC|nr:unnamed protein product [Vitrella brassicaformis CCMP3155]|eukprot:CEM24411.1 unnamed protein product [Vitrella brassicaformis CCMP3155]
MCRDQRAEMNEYESNVQHAALIVGELALGGVVFLAASLIPEKTRRKLLRSPPANPAARGGGRRCTMALPRYRPEDEPPEPHEALRQVACGSTKGGGPLAEVVSDSGLAEHVHVVVPPREADHGLAGKLATLKFEQGEFDLDGVAMTAGYPHIAKHIVVVHHLDKDERGVEGDHMRQVVAAAM